MRCTVLTIAGLLGIGVLSLGSHAQTAPVYAIDTVRTFSVGCDSLAVYPYWQVKGKYPESSQTLAKWADSSLHRRTVLSTDVYGNITFRLLIDCRGKVAAVKLLQTDNRYEPHLFSKELVDELYAFLKSLQRWRPATVEGHSVNYSVYLSFKIEAGHVVQVSP